MPYIRQDQRKKFGHLENLGSRIENVGELNYVISKICKGFAIKEEISYKTFNSILGTLDAVSKEIYRKQIAPYEDDKERENGTIWD